MSDPKTISHDQIATIQALVNDAGLTGRWFVTAVNGSEQDVTARYRAERVIPGSTFSVIHDDPTVLVALCHEADARFDNELTAVAVTSGTADTTGGQS
jgi:hypothetical protein